MFPWRDHLFSSLMVALTAVLPPETYRGNRRRYWLYYPVVPGLHLVA